MYVGVLRVLAHKGPLKLTHIMYKANVNCKVLKENLENSRDKYYCVRETLLREIRAHLSKK